VSELLPVPLNLQLTRAFLEYERQGKIFDLPKAKFFQGLQGLDTSVSFHGHRASTPVGPAAGPHDQLIQNIVLSWLAGSRIIELKTVQIMDELKIPRPCIDMANVGYNVEWSQELKLEQSLREYVGAAMLIEILKDSKLLGEDFGVGLSDTIYDMSVGYNLEGIRSPRVRAWIDGMKDATAIIDELRPQLAGRWARYRDFPFEKRISDTITLSTFHGCPAEEIEGIVTFLLTEMDVHVCVKLNPTLLGKEHVEHILHDVLGYHDILVTQDAFDKDLQFDDAMHMIPRLDSLARSRGKRLAVKFSNTLVVKNHKTFFTDDTMYMSGPPLHVLTLNLVNKFRDHMGATIPISFSAGLDAHNVANAVAMNFVPVTTCTDLLRPGGYGRLIRYLENLGGKMRELNCSRIPDFVLRYTGRAEGAVERGVNELGRAFRFRARGADDATLAPVLGWLEKDLRKRLKTWVEAPTESLGAICEEGVRAFDENVVPRLPQAVAGALKPEVAKLEERLVEAAGLLNTPILVQQANEDPRYTWPKNKSVPRKIGSKLWLFDCINCDKCVPDCPNDANFVYDTTAAEIQYHDYKLLPDGSKLALAGRTFKIGKSHQLANYADACNDCGNCDVFCPEDGGPQVEKPRFFGSMESYRRDAGRNGYFVEYSGTTKAIHGTFGGKRYKLTLDASADRARFDDGTFEIDIEPAENQVMAWKPKPGAVDGPYVFEMLPYLQLKTLLESVSDPQRVHYANVAAL
jgi:putative selenate reductase